MLSDIICIRQINENHFRGLKIERMFVMIVASLSWFTRANGGTKVMDYKKLIMELLDKISIEKHLEYIYLFVKKLAEVE